MKVQAMPLPALQGEREAILAMRAYVEARKDAAKATGIQKRFGDQLKAYLEVFSNNSPLYDGETDYEARMLERKGTATYDVEKMPDALVLWLARHGALNVDAKVAAALKGKAIEADDVGRYEMPGNVTTALDVKKQGER